jgi:hypothetical protein
VERRSAERRSREGRPSLAAGQHGPKLGHGVGVVRHRTAIALLDDASPMILGPRAKPDHRRSIEKCLPRGRLVDDAPGRGHDRGPRTGEDPLQRLAFDPPVVALPVQLEDLIEREAGGLLHQRVHLDEWDAKLRGEHRSHRALPGAAEACERDHRAARPWGAQQDVGRRVEGFGEIDEANERHVAIARFDAREESHREPRPRCQVGTAPPAGFAHSPDPRREQIQSLVGRPASDRHACTIVH